MQCELASWQGIGFRQWDPAILPVCLQSSLAILFLTAVELSSTDRHQAVYIVSKPIGPAWGTCGVGTSSLDGCWFFHCETWPWSGGFCAGQVHSPKMQVFQSHERHFMLVFYCFLAMVWNPWFQWSFETCQDLSECWEVLTRPGWHVVVLGSPIRVLCLPGLPKSDPDTSESSRLWCPSRSWVDKDELKDVFSIDSDFSAHIFACPKFMHFGILQIKETTGADLWTSPFSTLDSIASRPKKCIVYRLFREFSRALLINSQSICVRSDLRVRPVIPLTLPLLKTHSLRISHHTANRFSFFCVDRHRACAACETWTSGLKLGTDEDSYSRVLCTA